MCSSDLDRLAFHHPSDPSRNTGSFLVLPQAWTGLALNRSPLAPTPRTRQETAQTLGHTAWHFLGISLANVVASLGIDLGVSLGWFAHCQRLVAAHLARK